MSKGKTIYFSFEKETAGAVRYQETNEKGDKKTVADGAVIGTLYLRKSSFNGTEYPATVTVSLTFG